MSTTSNRFESSADPDAEANQTAAGTAEPNAGLGPTGDASGAAAGTRAAAAGTSEAAKGPRAAHQQPSIRWVWNLPLLLGTLAVFGVGIPVFVGLYYWQSSRIGGQLLQLADHASAEGDPHEEVQWLRRYLALQPDDVDVQIRIALTFDEHIQQRSQIDQSRRNLIRALTAVDGRNDAVEADLRERLIERLLQLGGGWLLEAERQIIHLNPPPDDPQALAQMARSLVGQLNAEVTRPPAAKVPEREVDFWGWLAAQPVGDVLRLAVVANPDSVELAGAFLQTAFSHPELFTADAMGDLGVREHVDQVLKGLSERSDSGQAQWIAYVVASREGVNVQTQPLAVVAAAALERLREHAANSETLSAGKVKPLGEDAPHWDTQLVLAHAANLASGQAFDAAKDLYQTLTSLPGNILSSNQLEQSYLGLGNAHWHSGNQELARDTWREGNQRLGGQNLTLLESLAHSSIQLVEVETARQDVNQFGEAVEAAALRLAGEQRAMNPRDRDALQKRLNTATWRNDVFHAHLDFRARDYARAAQRLERSLASQLTIETAMRVDASELLAAAYGEQGLWDLAGRVLEAAALLDPSNRSIRRQAAVAWQQASAAGRAVDQWQRADDGSFDAALAYAGALAASISAKAPAQRDYQPLVTAVRTAQQRLDRLTVEGEEPPAEAWRLAVLQLSLPAEVRNQLTMKAAAAASADADTTNSGTEVQTLVDLSRQFPQAAQLQAITALALERAGQSAAADEALQRLSSIADIDPLVTVEVQARLAAERGTAEDALSVLRDAMERESAGRLPIAKFGAEFMRSKSRLADAIALLLQLGDDEHDPQSLLELGHLLLISQQGASANETQATSPLPPSLDVAAELQRIESALSQLEGREGTHWRLLAAERLLQPNAGDSTPRRQRLTQAGVLVAEILSRRPRWSRALALEGRIAAEQGDPRKAVTSLRRAIVEGDKEAATVLLLVSQLNQQGDVAAAEQELQRLAAWNDSVGKISVMSVGLALAQGNNQGALERARAGVAARPADAAAYVILAQAAAAVAQSDSDQAAELHAESEQAVRQAQQLTGGRDLTVWQTQFRLQVAAGGRPAGREVLEAMQQSAVPEKLRFLALANGYLMLNDWDQARAWLAKAKQASPADVNVAKAEVTLFRATNDNEALVEALEQAHRLAPHDMDIRRQLAVALASQTVDDSQWTRISELIGSDRPDAAETDRLYHALLLISRRDQQHGEQARQLLADPLRSANPGVVDDATRLLLIIERRRWEEATASGNVEEAAVALEACERLFQVLVNRSQPTPTDLYGYGEWLLQVEKTAEAQAVATKLHSVAANSRAALELQLKVAKHLGQEHEYVTIVEAWLKRQESGKAAAAYTTVGQVMTSLGLADHAVTILRTAYQADPTQLHNYVIALVTAANAEDAVATCLQHFEQHRAPEAVQLMADVIVQTMSLTLITDRVNQVLLSAIDEFPTNLRLLESIGSLRLSQHRFQDALSIYEKTVKLNPVSLLTLNNMAIALAETPGRQREALTPINRAIELYGRNPELLDSLGIVQLRANLLSEAEATLREAYSRSGEAHHLLHLLFVLDASKNHVELKQLWEELDQSKLRLNALSPSEREHLERLQRQFESVTST